MLKWKYTLFQFYGFGYEDIIYLVLATSDTWHITLYHYLINKHWAEMQKYFMKTKYTITTFIGSKKVCRKQTGVNKHMHLTNFS